MSAFRLWIKHAVFKGKPWRSLAAVIWNHVESIGTKAYTISETKELFPQISDVSVTTLMTSYDKEHFPPLLSKFVSYQWGWFLAIKATK